MAIPVPAGFAPVVPEMKRLNQTLDAASYGENQRLGHLIPEGQVSPHWRTKFLRWREASVSKR